MAVQGQWHVLLRSTRNFLTLNFKTCSTFSSEWQYRITRRTVSTATQTVAEDSQNGDILHAAVCLCLGHVCFWKMLPVELLGYSRGRPWTSWRTNKPTSQSLEIITLEICLISKSSNFSFCDIFLVRRMSSSVMWHRMVLVRTDVSEEHIASIIRVTRIGQLGTTLVVTSNLSTLRRGQKLADSCHPEGGGDTFLLNVGSYTSHAASYPRRLHSA
jgi:hypothetical protein